MSIETSTGASGSSHPDIPDKSWSNPFAKGTFLGDLFEEVVSEERDLVIIVDDYYGRRGTGKTIASLVCADGMDQTQDGLTWGKTSLQPEEIRNAYASQEQRSGLVMDEGEYGASNRNPMSKTNQALREIISMGRVEQKYLVVNTPIKSFIDKDIRKMADVWITMVRRGLGLVHEFRWEPYSETLLTPRQQWIEFEDIPKNTPLRNVYNRLTREKKERIRGEGGDGFIERSEHNSILEKELGKKEREVRNDILQRICGSDKFKGSKITHQDVADKLGLSQGYVSKIVNEEV